MPDRADFTPEEFGPWFGHIGIVVAEKPERGSRYPRWRVALSGLEITAYDGADWTGQLLDEAVPEHARGEFVLVVGPPPKQAQVMTMTDVDALLRDALRAGSVKDAVAQAVEASGRPRREVYARALELSRDRQAHDREG